MRNFTTKAAFILAGVLGVALIVTVWRLGVVSRSLAVARGKVETNESLRAELTVLSEEVAHYRRKELVGDVLQGGASMAIVEGDHGSAARAVIDRVSGANGDLDVMFDAAAEAGALDAGAREEVIRWMKSAVVDGQVPSMYLIAQMQASAGDMDDAVQWMLTGNVMASVDAERYEDKAAIMSALRVVQTRLEAVSAHAKDRKDLQRQCVKAALEVEQQQKDRGPARWLEVVAFQRATAAGGDRPGSFATLSDAAWQVKRRESRAAFARWSGR